MYIGTLTNCIVFELIHTWNPINITTGATLSPVIQLLARVLHESGASNNVDVLMYESSLNHKKGFLTAEEERAVPIIKIYTPTHKSAYNKNNNTPASTGIQYEGMENTLQYN